MTWYEKLNEYFPIEEMKSKEHMETLLEERGDIYQKDEGPNHVLMYVEDEDYLFVDYLFVSDKARGQGIGRKLIEKMQKKNKPILLEVEPANEDDKDSTSRLRFYKRLGFQHASSISYRRKSLATNEVAPMEILYWQPGEVSEEDVFGYMQKVYDRIHTYKDKELYGKRYQSKEEVLKMKEPEEDILTPVKP